MEAVHVCDYYFLIWSQKIHSDFRTVAIQVLISGNEAEVKEAEIRRCCFKAVLVDVSTIHHSIIVSHWS
jgi:hypothetical protein